MNIRQAKEEDVMQIAEILICRYGNDYTDYG